MTEKFEVGEIAIICNVPETPEFHGMGCEIVGGLELRAGYDSHGRLHQSMAYEIRIPIIGANWIGDIACARPDQLRKKKPPVTRYSRELKRDVVETSAWQVARAKVNEDKIARVEGEGWFAS